jgi:hypothetical protein
MDFLVNFLIFVVVLFLYLHIIHQYSRSEDLEIYEMDYSSNKQLQEICDVKQPVLFHMETIDSTLFDTVNLHSIKNIEDHELKVKDTLDYYNESIDSVDSIVLSTPSCIQLIETDPKSHFFTENNEEFVEESVYYKRFYEMNELLKPPFTGQTKYDIGLGSKGAITPLRFHTYHRHFIAVNSGKITIKMTPWKSTKYLHMKKDYLTYEFKSPLNVWNIQNKYGKEMEKIKFLEFEVNTGYMVYIPAYWWYSIRYSETETSMISTFTYNSVVNILSHSYDWAMYFIQQQNTDKKIGKIMNESNTELDMTTHSKKIHEDEDEVENGGGGGGGGRGDPNGVVIMTNENVNVTVPIVSESSKRASVNIDNYNSV